MKAAEKGRRALVGLLLLLVVTALGALLRIESARSDPGFGGRPVEGLLQSDPGLLYYLTERFVEAGGLPEEIREDPLLAHPGTTDVLAEYTVGQEFLVSWLRPLFPADMPLHEVCLVIFSITAAGTALGVGWAARELTGSWLRGALAGVLFTLAPAAYRTLGFVLMREDLALPLLALHVALVLRVARTGGKGAALGAGVTAALCLATWHAMAFVLLIEAVLLWIGHLRGGRSPLAGGVGVLALVPVVVAALLVPALAARSTLGAPAVSLAVGMFLVPLVRVEGRRGALAAVALGGVWALVFRGGGDLGHVFELVLAKLRLGGVFPADPTQLTFEARMLWQGPFSTPSLAAWREALGWIWLPTLVGVAVSVRAREPGLILGLLSCVAAGWIAERMLPLVAVVGCLLAVRGLAMGRGQARQLMTSLGVGGLLVVQALFALAPALERPMAWYRPLPRQDELVELVGVVRRELGPDEAIAADFMTGTALLAHTGRPIVLQPKWETKAARERVRLFWETFYSGSPADLGRLLRERFACEVLVVDRYVLGRLGASRVLAGLRAGEPWRPGSAAEAFLGETGEVEGYRRVWEGERFLGLYRLE